MPGIDLTQYEAVTVKTVVSYRSAQVAIRDCGEGKHDYEFTCSSEAPVENRFMWAERQGRYVYGTEILLHGPENVDMSWIESGHAPFLKDHDTRQQCGVITGAILRDKTITVTGLKFSKSQIGQDVQCDIDEGIRSNVSIGYIIDELVEAVAPTRDKPGVYHATKWRVYEASSVAIPAVESVGFGRNADQSQQFDTVFYKMKKTNTSTKPEGVGAMPPEDTNTRGNNTPAPEAPVIVREQDTEASQIYMIADLNRKVFPDGRSLAGKAIAAGTTAKEFFERTFQPALLAHQERQATVRLGMSESDKRRFSLMNVVRSLTNDPEYSGIDIGFEREIMNAYMQARGITPQHGGFIVPHEAIMAGTRGGAIVSSGSGVGLQTEVTSGEVIEYLRPESAIVKAGARFINGLVGKFDMARVATGATSYWVGEKDETGAAVTTSAMLIELVQFLIKTLACYQPISRQQLKQTTIDVEAVTRADIFASMAAAIDLAALNGPGSANAPKGITYATGVGTETFTTAQTPLWANMVNMETTVAIANALKGSPSYITNPTLGGLMKQTAKVAGSPFGFILDKDGINGYPAYYSTNAIKSSTKNIVFGNFAELMVGMWGGLELLVNPYSHSAQGVIDLIAYQDIDVQLRHPASFVYTTN